MMGRPVGCRRMRRSVSAVRGFSPREYGYYGVYGVARGGGAGPVPMREPRFKEAGGAGPLRGKDGSPGVGAPGRM